MEQRLIEAVKNNNYTKIVRLFNIQNINQEIKDKALIEASIKGNLNIVNFLLKKGANIHANNDLAIIKASEYGHLNIVEFLVENGANIHANNDSVLMTAAYRGHLNIVKYLVSFEINNDSINSAFNVSIIQNKPEIAKILFKHGADINLENNSFLENAVMFENSETVKLLLDNGVKLPPEINYLLAIAISNQDIKTIEYLLLAGAVPDEKIYQELLNLGINPEDYEVPLPDVKVAI